MGSGVFNEKPTICWNCGNACGGCSWSKGLKEVEGWEATPTRVYQKKGEYQDSYIVHKCPKFKKDEISHAEFKTQKEVAKLIGKSSKKVSEMDSQDIIDALKQKKLNCVIYIENGMRRFYLLKEAKTIQFVPIELIKLFWKSVGNTNF